MPTLPMPQKAMGPQKHTECLKPARNRFLQAENSLWFSSPKAHGGLELWNNAFRTCLLPSTGFMGSLGDFPLSTK